MRSAQYIKTVFLAVVLTISAQTAFPQGETLYVSSQLTESGDFTSGIEGPACFHDGMLYAVNYGERGTIGAVTPEGETSLFITLPEGSTGNGIRFNRAGTMFIADYTGHNVLAVDMADRSISVFVHEDGMNQPNDLAIGADDVLYASDPNWGDSSGNVWRIDTDGTVTLMASELGTTNGIEVSYDEITLYVNESAEGRVLAYTIQPDGTLADGRLFAELPGGYLDGMRCDGAGNLYVTRNGQGMVTMLSPDGDTIRDIELIGNNPTNIAFGGPDGCTCYVTMSDNRNVETFRVEHPGRSWLLQQTPTAVDNHLAEAQASPITLLGNYPNPFNGATTIRYSLDHTSSVTFSVYSIIGQQIYTVTHKNMQAGTQELTWHPDNLPSGTYLYTISHGTALVSGKVMYMK